MSKEKKVLTKEEKDRRLSTASTIVKTAFLALLFGFLLTLATLLVPTTVESAAAVDDMRFGLPFRYLIQSFAGLPNEEFFPCKVIPKFTERYTTEIDLWMLLASFLVNSIICAAIIIAVKKYSNRKKQSTPVSDPEIKNGFAVTEDKKDLV